MPITAATRSRRRLVAAAALVVLSTATVLGCAPPPADPLPSPAAVTPTAGGSVALQQADRGGVVTVTPIEDLDAAGVTASLQRIGLDTTRVRSGVRALRVLYRTVDPTGTPTTASSLLVVPTGDGAPTGRLSSAVWLHGTTLLRSGVASMSGDRSDRPTAYALAAAGHAVTAPDYLGLGEGPGQHPYVELGPAATATVDALRASTAVLAGEGTTLSSQVLVTGHSQGGAATMAVGRALPEAGMSAAALVSLSGPFDVGRLLVESADGRIANAQAYLAYLSIAWNRRHQLWPGDGAMFRPPYDTVVPPLFDGRHAELDVLPQLPSDPAALFTDAALADLRAPRGRLAAAVAEAGGGCGWRPAVPVVLVTASGDRDVPSWNAEYCRTQLVAAGTAPGAIEVVDVGEVSHNEVVAAALPRVLEQFDAVGAG